MTVGPTAHANLSHVTDAADDGVMGKTRVPADRVGVVLLDVGREPAVTGSIPGWAVPDVETAGLHTGAELVEVGVVLLDVCAEPEGSWSSLVRPVGPRGAVEVHGLDEAALAGAPACREVLSRLLAGLAGRLIVGHNVGFDLSMVRAECRRAVLPFPESRWLDTRSVASQLGYRARSLQGLANALELGLTVEHRALADAWITARVWQRLVAEARLRGCDDLLVAQSNQSG